MPLTRQNAFSGKAAYQKRRAATMSRQSSARMARTTSYRQSGFPQPLPSRAPQGALETKSIQYRRIVAQPDNLGTTMYHVNVVAQGTAANQRLGNRFRCTALSVKGTAYEGAIAAGTTGFYVVWDKAPNGAIPPATDIFAIDSAAGNILPEVGLKPARTHRFTVLGKWGAVGIGDSDSNLPSVIPINKYVKMPKSCICTMERATVSGAIAGTVEGSLLLVPFSNKTADLPILNLTCELFFEEA